MSYSIYFRMLGYVVTTILHIGNAIVMMTSFHGEVMKNPTVRHFQQMQPFFFTCWTFTFQTTYSLLALYCDVKTLRSPKGYQLPSYLPKFREFLFSALVWPATVIVPLIFWPAFIVDRNLFYPKDIDLAIDITSNHIMHSYILVASVWDLVFCPRIPPKKHIWRKLFVLLVEITYIAVILVVYKIKGVWIYPIMGRMSGSAYFPVFFAITAAVLILIYYSQWIVNYIVWGSRVNVKKIR